MKRSILVLVLAIFVGCGREPSGAWYPAEGYVLTSTHKKAVAVARTYLAVGSPAQDDFEYSVEVRGGDYWVYVNYISGYRAFGEPITTPGAHCVIVVTPEYTIKEVIPGA